MRPADIRLQNQQLVRPQYFGAEELVNWMGALQAQDYKMFRLSICMRLKGNAIPKFIDDFDAGRIIRLHLFRSTWHVVSAEDVRSFIPLCSKSNKSDLHSFLRVYGTDISDYDYSRYRDDVLSCLYKNDSLTLDEILFVLQDSGIDINKRSLKQVILLMEYDGLLCSGNLHPRKSTYSILERKVSNTVILPREEAVSLLTRKYFQSHSPATLEDFIWWSDLTKREAQKGIASISQELETVNIGGEVFYIHERCRTSSLCGVHLHLIPPYDEFLIGYKSRYISVHPDFKSFAHDNHGIFYPITLKNGIAIGNWSLSNNKVTYNFFDQESNCYAEMTEAQLSKICDFYNNPYWNIEESNV